MRLARLLCSLAMAVATVGLATGSASASATAVQAMPTRPVVKPATGPSGSGPLAYRGGPVGVETAPALYIDFWGSQWSSDPSGEAGILQSFFNGVGGSGWNNSVTQYCQGVATGTVLCGGAGQAAGNPSGVLVGVWFDSSSSAPHRPSQSQLGNEAIRAAAHFGQTSATANQNNQFFVATSHGNSASGFGSRYCAWHSTVASQSYGTISYTNLPYITDAGASCGANFNGLGPTAGITIVAGHEFAETETDPQPNTGWLDSAGDENGDKCAWIQSGYPGASADVTLSTGTFAVQSLYSNAFNSGQGGCVLSYP